MRLIRNCAVLLTLSTAVTLTASSQSSTSASGAAAAGSASGPVDMSGFKQQIEQKNKALSDTVKTEEQIVKKNGAIIEGAKKIDAENKKLEASRKSLEAQNAEFEREREAIQAEQNGVSPSASQTSPQQPQRQAAPAPAPVAAPSRPASVSQTPAAVAARTAPSTVQTAKAPAASVPLISDVSDPMPIDPALRTAPYAPGPETNPAQNDGVIVMTGAKDDGPMRVSAGVLQGMLLSPIRPVYPQTARTAHVEGSVVLDATISKRGTVENVHAVSGPMILREAAIAAIQQARYQPYRLNEEPIEVETTITIAFEQTH